MNPMASIVSFNPLVQHYNKIREVLEMKISARNVLKGKIKSVIKGPVSAEISVELPCGDNVVSVITKTSSDNLDLREGKEVYVVIKATNVMIATD
jgi:molybdopterin-binding protein